MAAATTVTIQGEPSERVIIDAATLFRAHGDFVARFLHRLGVDDDELEDLMQDVFLVVHRRGGFEPGRAKATTYLAQIAIHHARDRRRLKQRRRTDPESEQVAKVLDEAPNPEERALLLEDLERVQQALDAIPAERRALFILFEFEDESCDAIAAAFDLPLSTVHSRIRTARREFIEICERLGKEGTR